MEKVLPKGWVALVIVAFCADVIPWFVGLVTVPIPIPFITIILTIGVSLMMSAIMQTFLFIWHGHNSLPSQFEHRLVTRLLVSIGEWIPLINLFPFWTLYALTYRVEEEEEATPTFGYPDTPTPSNRDNMLGIE